jgi:hypothetical protein
LWQAHPDVKNREGKTPLELNCLMAEGRDQQNSEAIQALLQVDE